jgi:hypothetical protein
MGIIEMTLKGKSENYGIARIDDNFISVFVRTFICPNYNCNDS